MNEILNVQGLSIDYGGSSGIRRIVMDVSFTIRKGEIFGLAGESGSGKSSIVYSLLGHVNSGGTISGGTVIFNGQHIFDLPPSQLAHLRGPGIGLVPQNPASALSPHLRIGEQLREVALWHRIAGSSDEARQLAVDQLRTVGLPEPDVLARRYPHELSGGQQQRVCIAIALLCKPALLLLDEPTTGLDVTTQAQIIELLRKLRDQFAMSMLYVTHDLGVLAHLADRLGIMYAGRIIELGPADTVLSKPRHPYTRGLIASVPTIQGKALGSERLKGLLRRDELPPGCAFSMRCEHARPDCAVTPQALEPVADDLWTACRYWRQIPSTKVRVHADPAQETSEFVNRMPLLEVRDLAIDHRGPRSRRGLRLQVPNLTLDLHDGEVLGLVGESGSGKSTIARAICGLVRPISGSMKFRGCEFEARLNRRTRKLKQEIQYVFQNPDASLNPRAKIIRILSRPLRTYFSATKPQIDEKVDDVLEEVSIDRSYRNRYPGQLSGGEKQRVAIARGLLAEPSVLLCDEILSSLDVSVQSNIIDLIAALRRRTGVTILFISHDLAVVRELSDRVAVLSRGEIVEIGPVEAVFRPPYHAYTLQLLDAIPEIDKRERLVARSTPAPARSHDEEAVKGCAFRSRCQWWAGDICDSVAPPWQDISGGLKIRCHRTPQELIQLAEEFEAQIEADDDIKFGIKAK